MSESDEPKIIVDEDWKAQVEREKEQLKAAEPASENQPDDASQPDMDSMPIPEASFSMLLATLSTQAIAAMGLMPDPSGNPTAVNLPMAKHFVDTVSILEEKTQGNLSDEEAAMIKENLHQLRMAYVAATQQAASPAVPQSESAPSSIELP